MDPSLPSEPRRARAGHGDALDRWLARGVLFRVGSRRLTLTTVLTASAIIGAFALRPGWESPIPTCFGYWLSGVPCPLCGITRAMIHLAHGQVVEALRYHPGVLLVFPLLVMGLIQAVVGDLWSRRMPASWRRATNVIGWAALLFIGLFGTVRAVGTMASGWVPW